MVSKSKLKPNHGEPKRTELGQPNANLDCMVLMGLRA